MNLDRPDKQAVRGLWLEAVVQFSEAYPDDKVPLYLTLSGAEGRDIALIMENRLVPVTETGAISLDHRHRIIAVERNSRAVAVLQGRFPGLKILEHSFENLVRSASPFRWPQGDDVVFCCARVVNLDLDETLVATDESGQMTFPVLQWVAKLGQIHAARGLDWCLCFTIHGEIKWSLEVSSAIQDFLAENFQAEPDFANACRELLGADLFDEMVATRAVDFSALDVIAQQHLLMVFVPKKIAQLLCHQGWRVETQRNLSYGGQKGRAPMVTWIMNFVRDKRSSRSPQTIYRESVRFALSGAGIIEEDGTIS